MVTQPFSTRPAYAESIRGLLRLHLLSETGQDDAPEAEIIRDQLERPWYDLSEVEKQRIGGLSEDLYSISELPAEPLPMNPQAQRKLMEAVEARKSGDWDKALTLLRRWGKQMDPAVLSFLRGTVWQEAGDYETATPFFRHAAQLDPADATFAGMYLAALGNSDPIAALTRAREVAASDQLYQPLVVAQAANIIATSTRGMSVADARPVLQDLAQILERVMGKLQSGEASEFSAFESTHASVTFLLGFCYERLGEFRKAIHYQNLGLSIAPRNEALLVARGTLRYGVDMLASDDFKQAILCGATMVWPFFFLAHHYLVADRFEECRRMCERALEFSASDGVRANLNEWLAIAEAELGFPSAMIRTAFEEAIRLAPDVDRIRRNLEEFEKVAYEKTIRALHWDKIPESEVQAIGRAAGFLLATHGPSVAA
jgi:tetratricopeptide (TPR) repeat protein